MQADEWSCRALSMRTRIRFLPARARVNLRNVLARRNLPGDCRARRRYSIDGARDARGNTRTELVSAGKRYADWFLRTGTTTVEAKSGYGLTLEDELKILRAIKQLDQETPLRYVPTFLGAHDIPPEYKSRREEYVSLLIDEMLPRVAAGETG